MKVRVEGTIHESSMKLILDDFKLLLVFFRCNLAKILRYFRFAKGNHSFVLKVAAKWYFDKSLVRSNTEDSIIIIKLSFKFLIRALVIQ